MKKFRIGILSGLVVMAVSAAPASAQTSSPPPCTIGPNSTVPGAVNCVIATAGWAFDEAADPVSIIRAVQDEYEAVLLLAQETATATLQGIDNLQKLVVNEVCTRFEIEPENCPDI